MNILFTRSVKTILELTFLSISETALVNSGKILTQNNLPHLEEICPKNASYS